MRTITYRSMRSVKYKKLKVYIVMSYGVDKAYSYSDETRILGVYSKLGTALDHADGIRSTYPDSDVSVTAHSIKDFKCLHHNGRPVA